MAATKSQMLLTAINYHGQQLTQLLERRFPQQIAAFSARDMDYHAYQLRSAELAKQCRLKRFKLLNFIAEHADTLFAPTELDAADNVPSFEPNEMVRPLLPCLGTLMNVQKGAFREHVASLLRVGDVCLCEVVGARPNGSVLLSIQTVLTLGFVTVLPRGNLIRATLLPKIPGSLNLSYCDLVVGVIIEIDHINNRIVSLLESFLPDNLRGKIKLDRYSKTALPPYLSKLSKMDSSIPYETLLARSGVLNNPGYISSMTKKLKLDSSQHSFLPHLSAGIDPKTTADFLRREQAARMALSSVKKGIDHFKRGELSEAYHNLSRALKIDPHNVDGLVARGALYANRGNFDKAVVDFELALESDPKHPNAKNYLGETIAAQAKDLEDQKEYNLALEKYKLCLKYLPKNKEAMRSIALLEPAKLSVDSDRRNDSISLSSNHEKNHDFKQRMLTIFSDQSVGDAAVNVESSGAKVERLPDRVDFPGIHVPPPGCTALFNQQLTRFPTYWSIPGPSVPSPYPPVFNPFMRPPPPVNMVSSSIPPLAAAPYSRAQQYNDNSYEAKVNTFLKSLERNKCTADQDCNEMLAGNEGSNQSNSKTRCVGNLGEKSPDGVPGYKNSSQARYDNYLGSATTSGQKQANKYSDNVDDFLYGDSEGFLDQVKDTCRSNETPLHSVKKRRKSCDYDLEITPNKYIRELDKLRQQVRKLKERRDRKRKRVDVKFKGNYSGSDSVDEQELPSSNLKSASSLDKRSKYEVDPVSGSTRDDMKIKDQKTDNRSSMSNVFEDYESSVQAAEAKRRLETVSKSDFKINLSFNQVCHDRPLIQSCHEGHSSNSVSGMLPSKKRHHSPHQREKPSDKTRFQRSRSPRSSSRYRDGRCSDSHRRLPSRSPTGRRVRDNFDRVRQSRSPVSVVSRCRSRSPVPGRDRYRAKYCAAPPMRPNKAPAQILASISVRNTEKMIAERMAEKKKEMLERNKRFFRKH